MTYRNGFITEINGVFKWQYWNDELDISLLAESLVLLKIKADIFLTFKENILCHVENILSLNNHPQLNSLIEEKTESSNGGDEGGEIVPPKLKYGQGSISKRERITKKGTYIYYEAQFTDNGKRKTVTAKTQTKCLERLREAKQEAKNRKPEIAIIQRIEPKAPETYRDLLNVWQDWKKRKKPSLSKSTLDGIERNVRIHITDDLKDRKLSDLKPYMFEDCLNNNDSSRMREATYIIFTDSLSFAKANDWIDKEIWKLIDHTKHKYQSRRPLEDEEYELLIKKADSKMRRIIIGYCWTGCRRNELLSIKYKDIENGIIKVWDQKTKKWKHIPVFPPLAKVLGSGEPDSYVFDVSPSWVNTYLREFCDSLNLSDISTHNLRHTFGSVLYDAEVPLKSIQLWLGHGSLKITEDIYTKKRKSSINKDIQELIEKMFGKNAN